MMNISSTISISRTGKPVLKCLERIFQPPGVFSFKVGSDGAFLNLCCSNPSTFREFSKRAGSRSVFDMETVWSDLNGAKRWNRLNHWNGLIPRDERSVAFERLERAFGFCERLDSSQSLEPDG
jgi:hypothetical protein